MSADRQVWPSLPFEEWKDTYATLHMWTQIVGKTRLALCPKENHWWHVALHVTSRGLTTTPIPQGTRVFDVQFDFVDHRLTGVDERWRDPRHSTRRTIGGGLLWAVYGRSRRPGSLGALPAHP